MQSFIIKAIHSNSIKIFIFIFIMIYFSACTQKKVAQAPVQPSTAVQTSNSGNKTVEIRQVGDHFELFRHGKPYPINGACGSHFLDVLRAAGGNSIRTYTSYGLDSLLDQAHANDLTVMVGLWVDRELEGFDYGNKEAVQKQKEKLRDIVLKYKDHPAVLCWAIGNEAGNSAVHRELLWPALDDIAAMIKEIDPNHPITIPSELHYAQEVIDQCPNMDFISINTAGDIASYTENFDASKPHLICEWACLGHWEAKETNWQVAFEESIPQKYATMKDSYQNYIVGGNPNCLGSYVFFWGQKQEDTPTWFSMFTEAGAKTALIDLMFELWTGKPYPGNLAPILDSLIVDGAGAEPERYLEVGKVVSASVRSYDPENDSLQYHWEVIPDGAPVLAFDPTPGKGWYEVRPTPVANTILEEKGNQIRFKVPGKVGAYRLLVYAHDGHGSGSYANMPFFVVNNSLTDN